MKGLKGLILALGMGVAAGVFNFMYLAGKSNDVPFIGIAEDVNLARGETIERSDLVPVAIPSRHVGNLNDFAVPYDAIDTVVGESAIRALTGGSLLLLQDLKTPAPSFTLEEGEYVQGIPIDTRAVVTPLLSPGAEIWVIVPSFAAVGEPTPAPPPVVRTESPNPQGIRKMLGPFKILSLGTRLSSSDVQKGYNLGTQQENVINVAVKIVDGEFQGDGAELSSLLRRTGGQPLGIIWRPAEPGR